MNETTVSKAKLILIVVCLIAIPVTFWVNHQDVGSVRSKVVASEPPCLKYGSSSRQCHESFQAAIDSITDFQLCTLLSKRPDLTHVHPDDCVKIAHEVRRRVAETAGSKEVVPSTGNPPSSQPGPPRGGHTGESKGVSNPPSNPTSPSVPPTPAVPQPTEQPASVEQESSPPPSHPEHPGTPAPKAPVRETVAGVGETVNGALEGVGDTGCKLTGCKP